MTADEEPAGLAGARPGQSVLLTVRFLTELALVAVLAWAGAGASLPLAGRIVLAVAAPVLAMIIWGLWLAPRARRRLRDPLRLTVELVLFAIAAAALASPGRSWPRWCSRSSPSGWPCCSARSRPAGSQSLASRSRIRAQASSVAPGS